MGIIQILLEKEKRKKIGMLFYYAQSSDPIILCYKQV